MSKILATVGRKNSVLIERNLHQNIILIRFHKMIYLINELKETDFGRNNQETVSTKKKSVM